MKKVLLVTTAAVFAGGVAMAQSVTDTVVADLEAQGYTGIKVKQGAAQIKVDAFRGGEAMEAVYDAETGAVLRQQTEAVEPDDDVSATLRVVEVGYDFFDEDERDDHDHEDDLEHHGQPHGDEDDAGRG